MSKPRPVYPGAVLFLTRRVHKRQLLLLPDRRLNQLIVYIVAVLVERYQVLLPRGTGQIRPVGDGSKPASCSRTAFFSSGPFSPASRRVASSASSAVRT
jgi:hypothetical protein